MVATGVATIVSFCVRTASCPIAYLSTRGRHDHPNPDPTGDRQRQIRQQTDFLATLLDELVGYAIIVIDFDGTIVTFNEGAAQLFGYRPEELIGQQSLDFLYPQIMRENAYLEQVSAILLEVGRLEKEEELVRRNGEKFPAHLLFTLARDSQRAVLGVVLIVEDLTERKRAAQLLEERNRQLQTVNENLRQAKAQADKANQAKSEFLSRMSHELRTPLNAILGFAQLLQMDNLPPAQVECVEQILRGGKHLLNLINEILDIARIESGRLSFSPEPVNVTEVVQECLDLVQPLAAEKQIQLGVDFAEQAGVYVLADNQRLKQILLNLLSNALKYNRAGGSVTITCAEAANNRFRLAVRDTGPGLTPAQLARLFIPFERLGAEGSTVEGTGLGLALSKGLVEAMGGTLAVASIFGAGSTFTVELARTSTPSKWQELMTEGDKKGEFVPGRKRTVLYIEDNVTNSRLIERILERWSNVRLLTAIQGSLGLELARQHHPDVLLLDLHLPDMPGEVVLRHIQADPTLQAVPVIVISADATPKQIEHLLSLGVRDYLTKPLDVQRFLTILGHLLQPEENAGM